ncbi:hypothetical protein BH11BAC5_BH11BAC5_10800 [soil metagenome]
MKTFIGKDIIYSLNRCEKSKEGKQSFVVGPSSVVQGSQKNHDAFIKHNLPKESPNSIWFEDAIAKAVLFRAAENEYGRAPNAIGDMRYITVPYTLAYLNFYLRHNPINWYLIWQQQEVSEAMRIIIKDLLYKIEALIKEKSPGSLYGQFAKDASCWITVRQSGFAPDITSVLSDLVDLENPPLRTVTNHEVIDATLAEIDREAIRQVSKSIWQNILSWNLTSEKLTPTHVAIITDLLAGNLTKISVLTEALNFVAKYAPELLHDDSATEDEIENTIVGRATRMIDWIKVNKHRTPDDYYTFIKEVRDEKITYNVQVQAKLAALEKWLEVYNYPANSGLPTASE